MPPRPTPAFALPGRQQRRGASSPAVLHETGVDAGANHACVTVVGGDTTCWGDASSRQLGNNATANSNLPVYMPRLG